MDYFSYNSGKSAGQNEAAEEFERTELESFARAISSHPAFRAASDKADADVTSHLDALGAVLTQPDVILHARHGLLNLFTKEAEGHESDSIKKQAVTLLLDNVRERCGPQNDDDDYFYVALDAAENLEDICGETFDAGCASEFLVKLTGTRLAGLGFEGAVRNTILWLDFLAEDGDEARALIENEEVPALTDSRLYRKFLTDAVQQYAALMSEKLDGLIPEPEPAPVPAPAP